MRNNFYALCGLIHLKILYFCGNKSKMRMAEQKFARYIKRLEIDALWGNHKHITWNLRPDVNILSGVNGVGKSTILNYVDRVLHMMSKPDEYKKGMFSGIHVDFEPADANAAYFDMIRSVDNELSVAEGIKALDGGQIRSFLDWRLYDLQRKFLNFQVNLGNRMIQLLQGGDANAHEAALRIAQGKGRFQDMLDTLYADTGKQIDRTSNELQFLQFGEKLSVYKLSAGEKQLLVILLTVLLQERKPYVLLMDEPEISLHVEWQQHLIRFIREINPNVQIILTTHSPAVIMDGWLDAVTEVDDITQKESK